tara:strand:+ start:451 stop:714 length:264 start_codon:yes stop_codon:yes gene_type:complete
MSKIKLEVNFVLVHNCFEVGLMLRELENTLSCSIEHIVHDSSWDMSHLVHSEVKIRGLFYDLKDKMIFDNYVNKILLLNSNQKEIID